MTANSCIFLLQKKAHTQLLNDSSLVFLTTARIYAKLHGIYYTIK